MTTFEEIFAGSKPVTDEEKINLARTWLSQEYSINVGDERIALDLLAVHTHGEPGQEHFGHPIVESNFGTVVFQIGFVTGRWHLSFSHNPQNGFTLVHPKSEGGSWTRPENQTAVTLARLILGKGKLTSSLSPENAPSAAPAAIISGNNVQLHIPESLAEDDGPAGGDPLSDLAIVDEGGRKSITIDLGSLDLK